MSRKPGSITRVGSDYRWRYFYRDQHGRRRSKSGRAPTRREAGDAMALSMAENIRGGRTSPSAMTLAEYLAEWMPTYAVTVRPTTASTTATMVKAYIEPRLGRFRLAEIKPRDIERFAVELGTDGMRGVNGTGGLSAKSVRNIVGALHRALDDAVRNELIARNPAANLRLKPAPRPAIKVWDLETLARFLDVARDSDDPMYPVWRLAATTGMRRGEVLGLGWDSVDLVDSVAWITETRVSDGSRMIESLPKTDAGRRPVSLDPETRDALARLRDAQEATAERLEMPPPRLVVTGARLAPMSRYGFADRWRAAIERAGAPYVVFHSLRHTWATQRLAAGVPDHIVAGRIGHANANITRAIYAEFLPRSDRAEAIAWGRDLDEAMRQAAACADRVPSVPKPSTSGDTERHAGATKPNKRNTRNTTRHAPRVPPLGFEPEHETREPE